MDVGYINPFLTATARLFETMIKVPLKLGRPTLRRPEDRLFKLYPLSAVMDVSTVGVEAGGGSDISGRVVISFAQPVACALAEALAGKPFIRVDDELYDAMGEIANMIVGGARTGFPNAANIRVSPPAVVPTHQVIYPVGVPVLIVPFDTAAGRFIIETALRSVSTPAKAA